LMARERYKDLGSGSIAIIARSFDNRPKRTELRFTQASQTAITPA
jgi:hypothetical protein